MIKYSEPALSSEGTGSRVIVARLRAQVRGARAMVVSFMVAIGCFCYGWVGIVDWYLL